MTANEFKEKVQIGTLIKENGDTFKCVDIPMKDFMYDFRNINEKADCFEFSLIGITDGSVEEVELVG